MSTGLTTQPKNEKLIVHDNSPAAYMFDTARFEHCYRIAKVMASASLLPDHLCIDKSKKELPIEMIYGNCFMIVNQAIRWGMDPFALPAETYVVGNKLGFQGKLIAAVINARAGLDRMNAVQAVGSAPTIDQLALIVREEREATDPENVIDVELPENAAVPPDREQVTRPKTAAPLKDLDAMLAKCKSPADVADTKAVFESKGLTEQQLEVLDEACGVRLEALA
jgi:hypothetical protein